MLAHPELKVNARACLLLTVIGAELRIVLIIQAGGIDAQKRPHGDYNRARNARFALDESDCATCISDIPHRTRFRVNLAHGQRRSVRITTHRIGLYKR